MTLSTTNAENVAVVSIQGEMKAVSASDLPPSVDSLVAESQSLIAAALSSPGLVSSSELGVGAMVFLYKKTARIAGEMGLHNLCGQSLVIVNVVCTEYEAAGVRQSRLATRGYLHLDMKTPLPIATIVERVMKAHARPPAR
jgi:hypothetical protein